MGALKRAKHLIVVKEFKMNLMRRREAGTTLIEIMVSLVVIAVGLLGLASMQINALKFQQTASQRSEAIQAAYDLADRMRANFVYTTPELFDEERKANEAKYENKGSYETRSGDTYTPNSTCRTFAAAGACTTDQIAANDLAEWQQGLKQRLPGGAGIVVKVAGTTVSTFDVYVMWRDPSFDGTEEKAACEKDAATPKGIRCFKVRISI